MTRNSALSLRVTSSPTRGEPAFYDRGVDFQHRGRHPRKRGCLALVIHTRKIGIHARLSELGRSDFCGSRTSTTWKSPGRPEKPSPPQKFLRDNGQPCYKLHGVCGCTLKLLACAICTLPRSHHLNEPMSSMLWDAAAAAAAFAVVQILMARRSVRPLEAAQASKDSVSVDPNRPTDSRGRTFHLQITPADVAPRILSVGDAGRAERISTQFDGGRATRKVVSSRGFITFTGNYRGVPISIIATGMGSSMMDFVVREARQVLTGPVAILRLGTCGGLRETTAGTVVVAEKGALFIRREPDLVASRLTTSSSSKDNELPYSFSELALPNAQLATLVRRL